MNLLRASIFNLERLDILHNSIGHPSIKLLSFEIAQIFYSQFQVSRYIMPLNWTSEYKVIVVRNPSELLFSIFSVFIYYGTQSDIRVKINCRSNLQRASFFNLEHLNILRDSIGHPSIKLLSFEFAQSYGSHFRASRYIIEFNQTSE